MFSEVSSERVQILIIRDFLRYISEVLFNSVLTVFFGISYVKVTAAFAHYLVNNTTSTAFTSLGTPNFTLVVVLHLHYLFRKYLDARFQLSCLNFTEVRSVLISCTL